MKKIPIIALVLISYNSFSQTVAYKKNEWSATLKNWLNINKPDFTSNVGFTQCKNTMSQSIAVNYTRVIHNHYLIGGGIEGGYDSYNFPVGEPYVPGNILYGSAIGFTESMVSQIPYVRVNIAVGYRFKTWKKWQPELRLMQTAQMPLKSQDISATMYVFPHEHYLGRGGFLGYAPNHRKGLEFLNSIYAGVSRKLHRGHTINIGLQAQRKFIFANKSSSFNWFHTQYKGDLGEPLGEDRFSGRHLAVSLCLGYTL